MRDTRRARLLFGAALMAALILMAISYSNSSSPVIRGLRGVTGAVFGSAERATSAVTAPVGRFFGAGGSGSSGQVAALQRQLAALRSSLAAAELNRAQYGQLQRLLGTAGKGGYRVRAASVIAFGQGFAQTVVLNAGSSDGVRPDETVLDANGLVGQVTSVGPQTCTVLLASDPTSVVGVRLAPSGKIGWVTGTGRSGGGLLKLQILDPSAVLRAGQQLVTAPSVRDRPFVPGVPVGVIAAIQNRAGGLTATALVRPYSDLTALGVVGIVLAPPGRDPGFSVLPPASAAGH